MIDLHIHSNYSDGINSPEEIVNTAIELGYSEIAICDHVRKTTEWFADYCAEMERLKRKYKKHITIYAAIEAKVTPAGLDMKPEFYCADLVYAALHTFPGDKITAFEIMVTSRAGGIVHPFRGLTHAETGQLLPLLLRYRKPLEVSIKYPCEIIHTLRGSVPLFVGSDSHSILEMRRNKKQLEEENYELSLLCKRGGFYFL